MYSFGPLPKVGKSGRIIGAHQKIDRVARRHLEEYIQRSLAFPDIKTILRFEGINGPDGVKLKSPGVDEPWHFINPQDPTDTRLLEYIRSHSKNLTDALAKKDLVKAGFEAAWLAHAVVDGLTPVHQLPESETLKVLREEAATKQTLRSKLIVPGEGSKKQFLKKNWQHWGAGGVMTTHTVFEAGVATTIKALKFENAKPSSNDLVRVKDEGFEDLYMQLVHEVAALGMNDKYAKRGWTRRMASMTRHELMPRIIKAAVLAWYAAYVDALKKKERKT